MAGDEHATRVRKFGPQGADDRQAIGAGQGVFKHHEVGLQADRRLEQGLPVLHRAEHGKVAGQKADQHLEHEGVIISEEDAG